MQKLFLAVFILLLLAGCSDQKGKAVEETEQEGGVSLSDARLINLSGSKIDLSAYKGKTVFINFWATWCKPCVGEMPSLQRLTDIMKEKNIVFLFASDEAPGVITDFKKEANYTMDFVQAESFADLNITGIPTTFIFDKNGRLVFSEVGAREWDSDEAVTMINKIINQ